MVAAPGDRHGARGRPSGTKARGASVALDPSAEPQKISEAIGLGTGTMSSRTRGCGGSPGTLRRDRSPARIGLTGVWPRNTIPIPAEPSGWLTGQEPAGRSRDADTPRLSSAARADRPAPRPGRGARGHARRAGGWHEAGSGGHRLGQGPGRLDHAAVPRSAKSTLEVPARSFPLRAIPGLPANQRIEVPAVPEGLGQRARRRQRQHVLRRRADGPGRPEQLAGPSPARPADAHPAPGDRHQQIQAGGPEAPAALRRLAADVRRRPLAPLGGAGPAVARRDLHVAAVPGRVRPGVRRRGLRLRRSHQAAVDLRESPPRPGDRALLP